MAMTTGHDRLPCGVELEALVAQLADGAPAGTAAHQDGCAYCQAALRGLLRAWGDVQALVRDPVPIPAGLTRQIMARIRALARHVAGSIVLGDRRGATRISHRVVGQVVQRIAATVPGVVFASARPIPHEPPEPARLAVAIRLVVSFGPTVEALAQTVRQVVERRVSTLTGAELSRIDIAIEDIAEAPD